MSEWKELEEFHPDLGLILNRFFKNEVESENRLSPLERALAVTAALIASGSHGLFKAKTAEYIKEGLPASALEEVLYQATAYLGIGRIYDFLFDFAEVLQEAKISLPLASNAVTEESARFDAGLNLQVEMFGEQMKAQLSSGPQDERFIRRWLAANCFGDYYTRKGLTIPEREMITLCFLIAQGGCEAQVRGHVNGNLRCGNGRLFLLSVISQIMPYIGYPRTLNALRVLDEVTLKEEK